MAKIYKLESDSSYNNAQVHQNQVLVYTVQQNGQVLQKAKLSNGSTVVVGPYQPAEAAICYDALPYPSAETLGKVAIYTGTTGTYIKGHTYQCIQSEGFYSWQDLTPSNTAGAGLTLQGTQFSIDTLSDSQTQAYLNLTQNGVGIKGINQKFQNYYTSDEVDQLIEGISNSTEAIKEKLPRTIEFSSVSNNVYTINSKVAVIGIFTNQGQYYPIEKVSVAYSGDNTLINVTAYLAYSNQATFTGTWKVLVTAI